MIAKIFISFCRVNISKDAAAMMTTLIVSFFHDSVIIHLVFSFFFDVLSGAKAVNLFEDVSFFPRFNIRIEDDVDAVSTISDVLSAGVNISKKKHSEASK